MLAGPLRAAGRSISEDDMIAIRRSDSSRASSMQCARSAARGMAGASPVATSRNAGSRLSIPHPRRCDGRGFTMVELIIVLVLVGILGAVAAGRFFDRSGFDAAAFADQTRALLRYGQKAAIARNSPVYVLLDENRIALCYDKPRGSCPPVSIVTVPGGAIGDAASATHCRNERWYCLGLPKGVQMSLSVPMTEFGFDALGRPVAVNGDFGGLAMTVTSADETRTVTVNPETGYVQ